MPPSFTRYLVTLGASLAAVFCAVWGYVVLAPMAYYEGGYPTWRAKEQMLAECQVGEIAFFGDSRLESGVVPALMPVNTVNFGVPAGTAVETRSAARRAAACPSPPKQAVIALTPAHFGPLSRFFWILSVRYGFISPGELWDTVRWADQLGDSETMATATPDGFSGRLRDVLYAVRFPSLSFNSLVQGRVFGRYRSNMERFAAVLRSKGWSDYGAGGGLVGELSAPFRPTKLQNAEFEATLRVLHERGIEALLLPMPFSQSGLTNAQSRAAYFDYLSDAARRLPGVRVIGGDAPVWPDELFVDGEHLTGAAAKLYTAKLAACVTGGRLQPDCDLDWHATTASQ
ncbi:MAG: hypothetical protein JOZ05_16590 [Acetobacteraceae bacterium]|nr:hypothetical protein [Acetobacteraceae bacterium]